MNPRIQELAEQATTRVDAVPNESMAYTYFDTEKFAQLIVRECADIMDGRDENGNAKDGQYLLTQFGIDASQRYT